jgi:flavin-dependent dehydrogenase
MAPSQPARRLLNVTRQVIAGAANSGTKLQNDKDYIGFLQRGNEKREGKIDSEGIRRKMKEELIRQEERTKHGGALKQYQHLEGEFADYLSDPYSRQVKPRKPLADSVDVIIIGGGFSSLLTTARLREAGVTSTRVIEKGGDVGGVSSASAMFLLCTPKY